MPSTGLKDIIISSPLDDDQKQLLLQALEDKEDVDTIILSFQQLLAIRAQEIAQDFSQIDDPAIADIQHQLIADIQKVDVHMTNTLTRLEADAKDLNVDIQQNKQDLAKAIEDTKKLSSRE